MRIFIILIAILFSSSCSTTRWGVFKDGMEVDYGERKFKREKMGCIVFAETGTPPPVYKEDSTTPDTVTHHSGTITDQYGSSHTFSGTSKTHQNQTQKGMQSLSNSLHNLGQKMQHMESYNYLLEECMSVYGYDYRKVPK